VGSHGCLGYIGLAEHKATGAGLLHLKDGGIDWRHERIGLPKD